VDMRGRVNPGIRPCRGKCTDVLATAHKHECR
jgi:hypothetical protein